MGEPRDQERTRKYCRACKKMHPTWHFDVDDATEDYEPQCARSKRRAQRKRRKPASRPNVYAGLDARGRMAYNLNLLYGMSLEQYDQLRAAQGYRCAICRLPEAEATAGGRAGVTKGRLHVDHDHATGVVRGLLCRHCNHMLGNAKDDPARLRLGIEYLRAFALRQIEEAQRELAS